MIDHIILTVSDFERSVAFYAKALEPLGITNFTDYEGQDGHSSNSKTSSGPWLVQRAAPLSSAARGLCAFPSRVDSPRTWAVAYRYRRHRPFWIGFCRGDRIGVYQHSRRAEPP